jgi:hypothetical protein
VPIFREHTLATRRIGQQRVGEYGASQTECRVTAMTSQDRADLILLLDFLLSPKTLTPRQQAALDRLRDAAKG